MSRHTLQSYRKCAVRLYNARLREQLLREHIPIIVTVSFFTLRFKTGLGYSQELIQFTRENVIVNDVR